jgi:uncharacterized membrane protein YccC
LLRHTRRRLVIRISKLEFRLGIRLTLAAVSAMAVGRMLGLHAFYWAGISAIVVSTGTPGGSFMTSLSRFGGTMAGLLTGLLSVWLLGHTMTAAVLAIPLAILLCQAVGLKASVKVAALSTLFPIAVAAEAHGLSATMGTVLSRAENVVVGCLVTLAIDGLIWPERVAAKLLARVRKDVVRVGQLAGDLLQAYVAGKDHAFDATLHELQAASIGYARELKELGAEEERDALRTALATQARTLHQLVGQCAALRDIQRQTGADEAQHLLRAEMEILCAAIRETTKAFSHNEGAFEEQLADLRASGLRLEAAYEGVRGDKGTQAYPPQEIFRLLGVLYLCGALVRSFSQLAPETAGGATAAVAITL